MDVGGGAQAFASPLLIAAAVATAAVFSYRCDASNARVHACVCAPRKSFAAESQVGHSFMHDLKELVETTYAVNGNASVVLLSHSMGCLYTLVFLNKMSQAWKDE